MTHVPDPVRESPAHTLSVPRPRLGWLWIGLLAVLAAGLLARAMPGIPAFIGTQLFNKHTIGGDFALTDHTGRRVTQAVLADRPYAIFFGFTHCVDVCPTTLQEMSGWLGALGSDAAKIGMVFVTVDPKRDTPAALGDYLKSFDPRILGLTGTEAEIADMLRAYRVYSHFSEVKNGDYAVDHSAAVFLMDRNGELKTVIGQGEKTADAVMKLQELIRGG